MKTDKHKRTFIFACLLGGLLVVIALLRFIPISDPGQNGLQKQLGEERQKLESEMKHRAEEERKRQIDAAKEKIRGLVGDAHMQMLRTIKTSQAKAASIIGQQKTRVPDLTSKVNQKLQGYGNALGLVTRMAEDKIRGTRKTQDYLEEAFQPVVQSEAQAEADLREILKDCAYELNIQAARLQAATANILDAQGFKAADLGLAESLKNLCDEGTQQSLKASMNAAIATLEVAVEALLVKTTYEAMSKLLAKAVAKESASLGIGAGGAAVPVVDILTTIIAVGGTAWTAYDVYMAVEEMKKIEPTIRNGLNESLQNLETNTDAVFTSLNKTVAVLCNTN